MSPVTSRTSSEICFLVSVSLCIATVSDTDPERSASSGSAQKQPTAHS